MESAASEPKALYQYEVLYHKRKGGKNAKHPRRTTSTVVVDGILTIEAPPSSKVTLSNLQQGKVAQSQSEEAEAEYSETSQESLSSDHESDESDESDGGEGTKKGQRQKRQKQFQKKLKKQRQKLQKKMKKTLQKSAKGKGNNNKGNDKGKGNTMYHNSSRHSRKEVLVYSAVNVDVASAVVAAAARGDGGLKEDDIIILPPNWECQIVQSLGGKDMISNTMISNTMISNANTIANNINHARIHRDQIKQSGAYTSNDRDCTTTTHRHSINTATTNMQNATNKRKINNNNNSNNILFQNRIQRNKQVLMRQKNVTTKIAPSSSSSTKTALPSSTPSLQKSLLPRMKRKLPVQPTQIGSKKTTTTMTMTCINTISADNQEEDDTMSIPRTATTRTSKTITPFTSSSLSSKNINSKKRNILGTKKFRVPLMSKSNQSIRTLSSSASAAATTATNVATTNKNQHMFHEAIGSLQAPHSIKSILRPHQVQGIIFLWNCVTGASEVLNQMKELESPTDIVDHDYNNTHKKYNNDDDVHGAILADEMGLGKTLMTITILFALYRQDRNKRFIVVCPSSLVSNWANEFDKWVGKASQPKRVVIKKGGEEGLQLIKSFIPIKPQKSEVLIISYDLFRMNSALLSQSKNIGLLVVDEGHRLKNTSGSLTLTALQSLNCNARLLITGTPVQNNLSEFHNVANFVNPGILGDLKSFRREYERPILKANNKHASSFEKEEGHRVSKKLDSITSTFMIRRMQKDVLHSLLPPRLELLLFCRPTEVQCNVYKNLTSNPDAITDPLPLLTKLRKICTHPTLVESDELRNVNNGLSQDNCKISGKLDVLDNLLQSIRASTNDKVVVVSNFTSALSIIEKSIIEKHGWSFLRLDGTVEQSSRQTLVESFNRCSVEHSFLFLLSSKAGGCGLNLCTANRLVMVDGDWNPATDLQAMARIYRQGQTKPTFIYRLFTSGTVEEVIYQRQLQKSNLASFTADMRASVGKRKRNESNRFTPEELRDCFTLKKNCISDTRDKIGLKWPNYDGPSSLLEQNCTDAPLIKLAKKATALSFVHLVSNVADRELADFPGNDSDMNIVDDDEECMASSSSEKEAEFD